MVGTQKIKVSDHMNGLGCDHSDDFVIDMESFPHPTCKDVTSNPRITLQRSLSRKGSQRGNEENVIVTSNPADKNDGPCVVATLSPREPVVGAGVQESMCTVDHSKTPGHHQITIMTNGSGNDSRFNLRRNSFRRASSSCALDPKRILIIFATLLKNLSLHFFSSVCWDQDLSVSLFVDRGPFFPSSQVKHGNNFAHLFHPFHEQPSWKRRFL